MPPSTLLSKSGKGFGMGEKIIGRASAIRSVRWAKASRRSGQILTVAAALTASGVALATPTPPLSIYVQFYEATSYTAGLDTPGAAAIGTSSDQWNDIGAPYTPFSTSGVSSPSPIALSTTAGGTSGVDLTYSGQEGARNNTTNTLDPALMHQYLAATSSLVSTNNVTLSGLTPNTTYNLYVYASAGTYGTQRATVVTANGEIADVSGYAANSFIQGDNYALLTPVSNSSGVINIAQTLQPGSTEADLNGFQIVQSAADTFTQNNHNSDNTGTDFWTNVGNWSTGVAAGNASVAVIPAANSSGAYNADLNGASETVLGVNLGAGSNIYNSGTVAETLTIAPGSSGYNSVFAGTLGGGSTINLDITGGTTTMSNGNNTYNGATTITGGTLALSGAGSIADSSGVNLSTGATFDISQSTNALTTINGLTGTGGTVSLGSKALAVDVA